MAVKVKDADWKPGGPAKPLPSLASFHVGETYLVPDGRRVQEVGAPELMRIMRDCKVPFDASDGHARLAEKWAKHLDKVHKSAGNAAVVAWLASQARTG
jgi:hypothetical protein